MPISGGPAGRDAAVGTGFPRASRLRKSRDFQRVSKRGRRASSAHFVLLVAPSDDETASHSWTDGRLGLTVSRRVGGAVVRNRLKRAVRAWFREGSLRGEGRFDWVVIARRSAAGLAGPALRADLDALGRQALARVAS